MLKKVVVVCEPTDIWTYEAKEDDYLKVYNTERGELFVDLCRLKEEGSTRQYVTENVAGFKDWISWKALVISGDFNYNVK